MGSVAVLALALSGCAGSPRAGRGGAAVSRLAGSGDPVSLRGVCPDPVVVQSSWDPQVEHGAVYQLLGQGYTVDAGRKSVTGPLVAGGVDTGVRLQIRAGGPAIGNQRVSAQMYADRSITLGMANTDEMIGQSGTAPLLGVMAPLEIDPQVIMWDPKAHPNWITIEDIGQSNAKVLYYAGVSFMDYLVGTGILRKSQVDSSYDGSPGRFVADHGQDAIQAYATNEPFEWSHEVPQWDRPLAYQLIYDVGYPDYANTLAIRPADRSRLDGCLRRLVPILQRAQVAFMAHPDPTIATVVAINAAYRTGFRYDQDRRQQRRQPDARFIPTRSHRPADRCTAAGAGRPAQTAPIQPRPDGRRHQCLHRPEHRLTHRPLTAGSGTFGHSRG